MADLLNGGLSILEYISSDIILPVAFINSTSSVPIALTFASNISIASSNDINDFM